LFLLAILVAPVLAKILDFAPPYRPEADTPLINALVIALMIGSMLYYWPKSAMLQKSVDETYPTEALPYLKAHPPQGPMLTHYLWGGYLGWKDRDLKVFIDSRVDIFEYAGVLQDYLDVLGLKKSNEILDKYKIQYVFFPPDEPLTFILQRDPKWKVIYSDKVAVLLKRTDAHLAGVPSK
jgi:hypothetical protein